MAKSTAAELHPPQVPRTNQAMKATITKDGELVVIAENDTESFALRSWLSRYTPCRSPEEMPLYPTSLSIDVDSFAQLS